MATETTQPNGTQSQATALTKRVLIVDDEPSVAALLTEFFRHFQYETTWAGNVRDALAMLLREGLGFDLILLDVHISWMGEPGPGRGDRRQTYPPRGLDLLKQIRKRGMNVPVIMLCPSLTKNEMDEAQSAGVFAWLDPPIDLRELERLVADAPASGQHAAGR